MKEGLLLVRVPYNAAAVIARAPQVAARFDTVTLDMGFLEEYRRTRAFKESYLYPQDPRGHDGLTKLAHKIVEEHQVSHAIITTPIFWYSEVIRDICDRSSVVSIWSEAFLSGKLIFDRIGCQYTAKNEIHQWAYKLPTLKADYPAGTKFRQPQEIMPPVLRAKYGVPPTGRFVVVFGQVPCDNALKDTTGCMKYYDWLDALFRKNPDTVFLFKQHPAASFNHMARTDGLDKYKNVRPVQESIWSLFLAFDAFAAYSSTVILEGAIQRKPFATGGHHFLSDPRLCYFFNESEGAKGIYDRLRAFRRDEAAYSQRLGFITRCYCMKPDDKRMFDRIVLPSEDFYQGHCA